MNKKYKAWEKYFENHCQQQALGELGSNSNLEYGECLYRSPVLNAISWVVTKFKDEYNVFIERHLDNTRVETQLAASFGWEQSAKEFALKMLLICNGLMTRDGEIIS